MPGTALNLDPNHDMDAYRAFLEFTRYLLPQPNAVWGHHLALLAAADLLILRLRLIKLRARHCTPALLAYPRERARSV
jgi:hypothetical protein